MRPTSRHMCGLLLAFALAGCSRHEAPAAVMAAVPPMAHLATPVDDESALILPDLMDLVVDPAAGVLFAAANQNAWPDLGPSRASASG